jgi:hypothetical protein
MSTDLSQMALCYDAKGDSNTRRYDRKDFLPFELSRMLTDLVEVRGESPLRQLFEPLVLKKSPIAERKKSPTSIMPKGLLDKLTHEEILDLIAFVAAKGDARHALFQGGHDQGH